MSNFYQNLLLENLQNEEWLPIDGFEGKYEISSLGRVKSLMDKYGNFREKILKQYKDKDGYLFVWLYKEGSGKIYKVHRLVGNAFLENKENLPFINHKDENPSNNCVSNLEWCSVSYNNSYGDAIKKRVNNTNWKIIGEKNAERLSKKVFQYDKKGNLIKIWSSTKECKNYGFTPGNVAACCRGKLKSHKEYIWSYEPIK